MKKLFFLLFITQFCFSQIEKGTYIGKHISHEELVNGYYEVNEEDSGWVEVEFFFESDYYTYDFGDQLYKIWYEYDEEDEDGNDRYIEEGGELLVIDYENQEIIRYSDVKNGYYQYRVVISKIEKE